ncbi:MAG: hypothetical protein IJY11_02675 [Clostridia bacterium]|nr:hypothetical protein [Clostridia bacterium]
MEERLIDEEYGRGVKLKKTKDGYVDVTDAALDELEEAEGEEISFEFPVFEEEDDEELAGLSPEAAMELRQKKAEMAREKREEYERLCAEGNKLLETGSFKAAELKFERAIGLDEKATEATVGYWRSKTADFDEAEVLVEEYADEGTENMEFDLGYEAITEIGKQFREKLQVKYDKICEEEESLMEVVTAGQERRKDTLKKRVIKTSVAFAVSCALSVTALVFAIYYGLMNFTVSDDRYIVTTIVLVAVFIVTFVAFGICTNKFVNACRIKRANGRLSSTEEGARVEELRNYKEIYEYFLQN